VGSIEIDRAVLKRGAYKALRRDWQRRE